GRSPLRLLVLVRGFCVESAYFLPPFSSPKKFPRYRLHSRVFLHQLRRASLLSGLGFTIKRLGRVGVRAFRRAGTRVAVQNRRASNGRVGNVSPQAWSTADSNDWPLRNRAER